jgi:hypothetical protein
MLNMLQLWLGQIRTTSINSLKKYFFLLPLACRQRYGVENSVDMFSIVFSSGGFIEIMASKNLEESNSSNDDFFKTFVYSLRTALRGVCNPFN